MLSDLEREALESLARQLDKHGAVPQSFFDWYEDRDDIEDGPHWFAQLIGRLIDECG